MLADTFTLKELKLAFINEDIEKLKELSQKTPKFSSLEEAKEIYALLQKVNEMLIQKKEEVLKEMQQIKKLQKFHQQEEVKKFDFKV